ncbi:KH domain-containing protein At1g09660/At1g09670-like [Setaria italica]|uniref:KH domain-containing protein At1g09660/At1g09670-like n=1 Tax=Setaria italica TaxID=4555 RepID=UPI000BE4E0DA|nr:KH domain-containing protein At1g09660/At1g09670-like [Setaria italica]
MHANGTGDAAVGRRWSLFGRYLAELLAERQKLAPFVQVLPFCTWLLNQEILRASTMAPNHNFVEPERIEHGSPLRLPGHPVNGQPMDLEGGWSEMQTEVHIRQLFIPFCITYLFGHWIYKVECE